MKVNHIHEYWPPTSQLSKDFPRTTRSLERGLLSQEATSRARAVGLIKYQYWPRGNSDPLTFSLLWLELRTAVPFRFFSSRHERFRRHGPPIGMKLPFLWRRDILKSLFVFICHNLAISTVCQPRLGESLSADKCCGISEKLKIITTCMLEICIRAPD